MRRIRWLLLVLALFPAACEPAPDRIFKADPADQGRYLPRALWTESQPGPDFYERWFGKYLKAMGEQPLWPTPGAPATVSYRLLVLPSFDPPSVVRFDIAADRSVHIVTTRLDGAGGYQPGKIVARRTAGLPPAGARYLRDRFEAIRFQARVPELRDQHNEFGRWQWRNTHIRCLDGTDYMLERRDGARYNLIVRHQCELDDGTRTLIKMLARAGGVALTRWQIEAAGIARQSKKVRSA